MFLLLVHTAAAATVTDVPTFLRGDVWFGYTYDRLAGGLTEVDYSQATANPDGVRQDVGDRRIELHQLHYGGAFGVGPGVAIYLDIPHDVSEMVTFDRWHDMVYAPSTGSGTYMGSAEQAAQTMADGGGIEGVWIGVRGTPYSSAFKTRPSLVTVLLDGAIRTPNADHSFWVIQETADSGYGTRGAGPGGLGLRLRSAFSTHVGAGEPYIVGTYFYEGPSTVDLTKDDGTTINKNAVVDPGDGVALRFGTETRIAENTNSGMRVSLDMHANAVYTGAGNVPTGVYLPGVLIDDVNVLTQEDGSSNIGVVQTSESLETGVGLDLCIRPFQYMQLDLRGDVAYHLPQRVESPYPEYTSGATYHMQAGADLTVRIR